MATFATFSRGATAYVGAAAAVAAAGDDGAASTAGVSPELLLLLNKLKKRDAVTKLKVRGKDCSPAASTIANTIPTTIICYTTIICIYSQSYNMHLFQYYNMN